MFLSSALEFAPNSKSIPVYCLLRSAVSLKSIFQILGDVESYFALKVYMIGKNCLTIQHLQVLFLELQFEWFVDSEFLLQLSYPAV
jgi:hypothetical protein